MERSLLTARPIPSEIWVLYRLNIGNNTQDKIYIETAPLNGDGRPGSFSPMGKRRMQHIIGTINKKEENDISIQTCSYGHLLYLKQYTDKRTSVIWYTDPMVHKFSFIEVLEIENGYRPVPGLIWYFSEYNKLYLWSYKEWKGDKTLIYKAPIHNVYERGEMCIGLGDILWLKNDTVETFTARIEAVLFGTFKSEIHDDEGYETNLNSLYRQIKDQPVFPEDGLIPFMLADTHLTLRMLISKYIPNANKEDEDD